VKEQSHKDEMSAAIRGDFQRLRARGVAAALAPQEGDEIPAQAEPPTGDEPGPPIGEESHEPPVPPGADGAREEPTFLSRLLGR
jgi:hypothetical protein